ncbi:MAG: LTA synthase family protein [Prevotella sp.]|nr:LTA synthase family protein [Prevotella sp.]
MRRYIHSVIFLLAIHVMALLLTTLFRVFEFCSLHDMLSPDSYGQPLLWGQAFLRGIWFDNVVACYLMLLPLSVVLLAACLGFYHKAFRRFATVFLSLLYCVVFAVSASNIPYFQYFFKNIDATIFGWFGYAGTTAGMVFGEASYWLYICLFFIICIFFILFCRFVRRKTDKKIMQEKPDKRGWGVISAKLLITLCLIGLCVFGIRGRTGYNPIKVSEAYYCKDPFLNQLGISPTFNLLTSWLDTRRKENRELKLMSYDQAISETREWFGLTGPIDSTCVLRRELVACDSLPTRRNVVIILIESMSAHLMQTFGQKKPLTPVLDSLYQQSIAFSRFYSAGIHTNHGLTATLCSFPAMMFRNLMKGTITPHRAGIPSVLKAEGYHNLFFMTHEAQYDNMNAFLLTNGYDDVYAEEDYPTSERVNAFGVSDHFLFEFALPKITAIAKSSKPFMATLLTISNHPPYVIPSWFHAKSKEPEDQIVEYTDWCIGDFLEKAKKQPWYDNTVFVVLADHGKLVGHSDSELPQSYNHIPLMIFGKGITPYIYNGLGTQVDVMPTLFGLLGIGCTYDGFGVNLLQRERDMVFYTSDRHLIARDSSACYIYEPAAEKSFYYQVLPDGSLQPTQQSSHHDRLRNYVFSMIQTAEYMERR